MVWFFSCFSSYNFCTPGTDTISRLGNKATFADFSVYEASSASTNIKAASQEEEEIFYLLTLKFPGFVIVGKHWCSLRYICNSAKILCVIYYYVFWNVCLCIHIHIVYIYVSYVYIYVLVYISINLPNPVTVWTNQQKRSAFLFGSSKNQLHF